MTWSIEFLDEAEKDMKKLDHSAQIQVLKGIRKVSQNPLPTEEGGACEWSNEAVIRKSLSSGFLMKRRNLCALSIV